MNQYNPNIHHRRSIRLKGYDYSRAGLYFITICCQDRASRFGQVVKGEMVLNEFGQIAYNEWMKLSERFPNMQLDVFQIMPNHMHGIIALVRATLAVAQNTPTDIIVGAGFTPAPNDISVQTNSVVPNSGQMNSGEMDSGQAHDGESNFQQTNSIVYNRANVWIAQNTPTDIIVGAGFTPAPNDISVQTDSVVPNSGQTNTGQAHDGERIFEQTNLGQQRSGQPRDGESNFQQTNSGQPRGLPQRDNPVVDNWATARVAQTGVAQTVGDIVGAYKSLVANECLDIYKAKNKRMGKLWQRNYHEHIIRNEHSYQRISEYIINNPAKWAEDKFYEK
ncbi:MAG: hypothetical protein Q8J88_18310 [Bacteroidales bacterium]|nr:hypothetical protein [Bacteroidales bacterium]